MKSKKWMLFLSLTAMLATACARDNDEVEETSVYTGIWANRNAMSTLEFINDLPTFCQQLSQLKREDRAPAPYAVQANGEVYVYSPAADPQSPHFRKIHFRGNIYDDGTFVPAKDVIIKQNEPLNARARLALRDDGSLRVYKGSNHYFVRVTPDQIDDFMAARQECYDLYQGRPGRDDDFGGYEDEHGPK